MCKTKKQVLVNLFFLWYNKSINDTMDKTGVKGIVMASGLIQFAVAYVIGVYFASRVDMFSPILFLLVFCIVNAVIFLVFKKYNKRLLIVVCAAAFGLVMGNAASDEKLNEINQLEEKYVTMTGCITELPRMNEDGNFSYVVTTVKMEYMGEQHHTGDLIRVTSKEQFAFGDTIEVRGFLKRMNQKMNKHDFDLERYYKSRGIFYRLYAEEISESAAKVRFRTLPFYSNMLKNHLSNVIDQYFAGDSAAMLKAVITGNKHTFSEDFENLLYRTGTMRYFYAPYIHLLILLGIIAGLFGGIRKERRDYIVVGVLLLYAAVNSSSPIFAKAALLTVAGILFSKRYGYTHYPDLLAMVVLIITLLNPLYVFDVSFTMSVAASLLIYHFRSYTDRLFLFVQNHKVRKLLSLWVLTTVGLSPLAAYFFDGITVYSGLLLIVYLPLVAGVLAFSLPFFLACMLFGSALGTEYLLMGPAYLLQKIPVWVSRLPFYYVMVPRPSELFLVTAYSFLPLLKWAEWGERKTLKFKLTACTAAGFSIALLISGAMLLGKLNITFVNVGQGDGAILHIPFRETILIDGGGGTEFSAYDPGERLYLPYLNREGYYNIDFAVVSHYHKDHCMGIIAAMKNLNVRNVLLPAVDPDNAYRVEIEQLAAENGTEIHYLEPGDTIRFRSGLALKVLSPDQETRQGYTDENDTSIVLDVTYGEFKALFTGDISDHIEDKLYGQLEDYDLVKVPHHGSRTSSSEEFVEKTDPEAAVVSVGENNVYNLPNEEVIQRYMDSGAQVLMTSELGDITVLADKKANMRIDAFRD